ncbi:alpha/beta-hydrolase [Thelephora terrestris]|uniref:Alpha/beta-hydrolase n=1 Tax=Thelephora terrestris TaxID=56493 RepID=A0A9P6LCJ5_9AGAM|nr:alpha/beta-hydrolase [Thelephora terrestris]
MVALLSFIVLLLPVFLARSSPIVADLAARSPVYNHDQRAHCGFSVREDVTRFVVKYANAQRWKPSTPVSISQGASLLQQDLPPACPQSGSNSTSEDCLYMVVYVPNSIGAGINAPSLLWIHGGSFTSGSASDPAINGANLAAATQSIVAVVQYRLGGLGFMAPNGGTNLAVGDVINALKVLNAGIPMIGGSSSKITIAGQSSGATMVRALLATPSASSLFRSAIIQSDPMDYGFLSPGIQQTMQNFFNEQFSCNPSDDSCASSLSVSDILQASDTLYSQAMSLNPAAGQGEPIRPVHDGQLITNTLTTSSFPQTSKSILVSTVVDEAGSTIYTMFPSPVSEQVSVQVLEGLLGTSRADTVLGSERYVVQTSGGVEDARPSLENLGTDYLWKCSSWTFSRTWASSGGPTYVGMYIVGATYPANAGIPFCTSNGAVCHQDDIQIVFGTASNPNTQQTQLIQEMQARYKSFLNTGNPNVPGLAQWNTATSSSTNAILLGGSGPAPVDACTPNFWGGAVSYDYQVYGL